MFEQIVGSIAVGLGVALFAYAGADYFARALDFVEADIRDKLRRLRIRVEHLRKLLAAWFAICGGVLLAVWVGLGMPVVGLAAVAVLVLLPWYLLRRLAEKRRQQIEDQLADAMVSLSSAIKSGLSLAQSLEILAQQSPRPICQEFQQIVGEYQMGKTIERCLAEAKQRLRSENFALFAAAMEASRESGGRLNETVERIAHSVRELQRLERKVMSETAQARASAFYMSLAPLFILAIYYFLIDPQATSLLFTRFWGQMILVTAFTLNLIAYLWARAIMSPDI